MQDVHRKRSDTIRRIAVLAVFCATVGAIACGSETSVPTRVETQSTAGPNGGTDTGGTQGTSNGPVASVSVSPKQVSLPMGYYTYFVATPRDANGLVVAGKHAMWTSSNASVLVASDSGVFYAKAIGLAKVYGTVDGHIDSAAVVVTAAPVDTSGTRPPSPVPVSSFNLAITVDGPIAGTDTTQSQHVPGTIVTVTRVMGVHGDTLNPSVLAGTITTDANGAGALQNLPGGYYTFLATPLAGSGYVKSSFGIGAPTTTDVKVRIVLQRAP